MIIEFLNEDGTPIENWEPMDMPDTEYEGYCKLAEEAGQTFEEYFIGLLKKSIAVYNEEKINK